MKKNISYGNENDTNLKLVIGANRTASLLNRGTQSLVGEYGLTVPQFGVLEALYHLGDLKICEIIEKTLSTSGNMTVVIKNLERDGFVERHNSPEDLRVSLISLTSKGTELIEKIFPLHVKALANVMDRLTIEEKAQLQKLLKKLNGVE